MTAVTSAFPLIGNLLGLPHGWARGLGVVGAAQTSYLDDFCSPIFFGTSGFVNPAGNIMLYIVTAEEAGHFTDGIDPNSTLSQTALIGLSTQANLVQQLGPSSGGSFAPNTRYCFNGFSIKALLQGAPSFWSLLVLNLLGGPLSVTIPPYAAHTTQT